MNKENYAAKAEAVRVFEENFHKTFMKEVLLQGLYVINKGTETARHKELALPDWMNYYILKYPVVGALDFGMGYQLEMGFNRHRVVIGGLVGPLMSRELELTEDVYAVERFAKEIADIVDIELRIRILLFKLMRHAFIKGSYYLGEMIDRHYPDTTISGMGYVTEAKNAKNEYTFELGPAGALRDKDSLSMAYVRSDEKGDAPKEFRFKVGVGCGKKDRKLYLKFSMTADIRPGGVDGRLYERKVKIDNLLDMVGIGRHATDVVESFFYKNGIHYGGIAGDTTIMNIDG